MEEEKEVWVNTKMLEGLLEKLDEMVREDDSDRSKFIRNLIREEYDRRNPNRKKTNPRMRAAVPA